MWEKILSLVLLFSIPSLAFAAECGKVFDANDALAPDMNEHDSYAIQGETHFLRDLVNPNVEKNLAYQHPAIIMNAAQRVEGWLRKHPARQVLRSGFGGTLVNHYPLLQEPLPENGGTYIVGQSGAIQAFVDGNHAAAVGDGSAVKTLTFEGGAGTGKTLFLDILGRVSRFETTRNPDSYMYSIEWVDLKEIAELYELLRLVPDPNGDPTDIELPFPSAIYESPFTLLPAGYQKAVLDRVGHRAAEISGIDPEPVREPNPQNAFMRDAIIRHYAAKAGKTELTPQEVLAALDKHVRIKRYVLGANGKTGKIGYQGKDIDWGGLVFTENPVIKAMYGPSHPFAYHYNGKILQSQGGFMLWDEFWRNEPALRDFTLDVQESRIVARGGAPAIYIDAVIMGASNSESIAKVMGEGTSKAQLDRATIEPMRYSIDPSEIGRTILMMKGAKNLVQVKLVDRITDETLSNPPLMEPAELMKLYPLRTRKAEPYLTPDRRFGLYYRGTKADEPVLISPWTLALIEYMTSVTRMVTSEAEAVKAGQHYQHTFNKQVFRDPIDRLKALIGELRTTAAEENELHELSMHLREGVNGLSTRDVANIWLTRLVSAARRPENENTASPFLAKKVFLELLESGGIHPSGHKERLEWMQLMDRIIAEMIVPSMEADINTAIGQTTGDIDAAYDDIVRELIAIGEDPSAQEYESATGESRRINLDRLNEINTIYNTQEKRALAPQEIINLQAAYGSSSGGNGKRHPGLLRAIQQYQARLVFKQVSFSSLAQVARNGAGDARVQEQYNGLTQTMIYMLGYNRRSIRDAIELIEWKNSPRRQVK